MPRFQDRAGLDSLLILFSCLPPSNSFRYNSAKASPEPSFERVCQSASRSTRVLVRPLHFLSGVTMTTPSGEATRWRPRAGGWRRRGCRPAPANGVGEGGDAGGGRNGPPPLVATPRCRPSVRARGRGGDGRRKRARQSECRAGALARASAGGASGPCLAPASPRGTERHRRAVAMAWRRGLGCGSVPNGFRSRGDHHCCRRGGSPLPLQQGRPLPP